MQNKKKLLRQQAKATYKTVGELVTEVAKLIPYFAPAQAGSKVALYPDERTIWFYLRSGLIEKRKDGAYKYKTLLQILAIKFLQQSFLPLRQIKQRLKGLDEEELVDILIGGFGRSEEKYEKVNLSDSGGEDKLAPNKTRWIHVPVTETVVIHIREDNIDIEDAEFVDRLTARLRLYLQQVGLRNRK